MFLALDKSPKVVLTGVHDVTFPVAMSDPYHVPCQQVSDL
jgi:hypothetical protein